MRNSWRGLALTAALGATAGVAYLVGAAAPDAKAASANAANVPKGAKVNACGCYRDSAGSCFCGKKGKCDCPGDCEPKGCEEKRAKEMEKEVEAETKRARDLDKKQRDADLQRRKKMETVDNQEEAAAQARLQAEEDREKDGSDEKQDRKAKKSRRGSKAGAAGEESPPADGAKE